MRARRSRRGGVCIQHSVHLFQARLVSDSAGLVLVRFGAVVVRSVKARSFCESGVVVAAVVGRKSVTVTIAMMR